MKKTISLLLAALMLLSLCACGADTAQRTAEVPTAAAAPEMSMNYSMADMAVEESADYGGFAVNSAAVMAAGKSSGAELPAERPDKIIYSADATVETTDFDGTVAGVAELVEKYGGWIESSSINGANYYNIARGRVSTRSAHYTLRVPGGDFETIMGALSTLGNVPYSHTYTENISAQYYDTEARLTAYETQEARLLEMLEIAETVEDIISIEEKLTELRYKIESLQSSLKNWDRQVSYSSIYLNIEEVEKYSPESMVQPSYGEKLRDAFESGVAGFVDAVGDFFIWLVEALPSLVVICAAAAAMVALIRRRRNKKKAKKADGENLKQS